MRSLVVTVVLLGVLAAAGVTAGSLLRGDDDVHASTTTAAGIKAVGAAYERVGRKVAPGLHLQSVGCRPFREDGMTTRCVGLLARTDRTAGAGLPWIEVRLDRLGVRECKVMGADTLPKADCARAAGARRD